MSDIEALAYRRGESLKAANKQIDELMDENAALKARAEKAEADLQRLLVINERRGRALEQIANGHAIKLTSSECRNVARKALEGAYSNVDPRD